MRLHVYFLNFLKRHISASNPHNQVLHYYRLHYPSFIFKKLLQNLRNHKPKSKKSEFWSQLSYSESLDKWSAFPQLKNERYVLDGIPSTLQHCDPYLMKLKHQDKQLVQSHS